MPPDFIVKTEEFEDENGVKFVALQIGCRKNENPLKNIIVAGAEIAIEAAILAFSWKFNLHPAWSLVVSAMWIVSFLGFCKNVRSYIWELTRLQRQRLLLLLHLVIGIITFFTFIHGFSELLKSNCKVWILYFGTATFAYFLAVSSVIRLGRTFRNRSLFTKCLQLLFGPALIGCAACYLNFRQHEEKWLVCLPRIASALVANQISVSRYRRVQHMYDPRWLLFKGLDFFVGGWLSVVNGSILVAYSLNNNYFLPTNIFFIGAISNGFNDIRNSLYCFQDFVDMEASVFHCICEMIGGPIFFVLGCLGIICTSVPIMLPVSTILAEMGLLMLTKAVFELHYLVPQPIPQRYYQRVLGALVIVYGLLIVYGNIYNIGWRSCWLMMPMISFGICFAYQGFRRRNGSGQ